MEVEQLAAEIPSAKATLEKLLTGAMSEEESMELALVLAQNLHTDAELAHNVAQGAQVTFQNQHYHFN